MQADRRVVFLKKTSGKGLAALENRSNLSSARVGTCFLWAARIFKCQRSTEVFEGYVYAGQYIGTCDFLICIATAPGFRCATVVLWCYRAAEEENNAPALQKLKANIRQNSTGESRQGNK